MTRRRAYFVVALVLAVAAVAYLATTSWRIGSGGPTLLYFYSDLCAFCRETTPIIDDIRREYRARLHVVYISIDELEGRIRADEYGVFGTPTILLLSGDGEQVNVLRGSFPAAVIERAIEDLLALETARQSGGR
jgi:thioredoxin 1